MSSRISQKPKKGKDSRITPEIELRRQRVYELRLKKIKLEQIAEMLKVTRRTIDKDIAAIRDGQIKSIQKQISKFDSKLYWADRKESVDLAIKELWLIVSESKGDRVAALQAIPKMLDELDKCLRAAGIRTTDVDPESLVTDTLRIIHEYPDGSKSDSSEIRS